MTIRSILLSLARYANSTAFLAALSMFFLLPHPLRAAEEAPDTVVAALYALHAERADHGELTPVWRDESMRKAFFTDPLLALFDQSAAAATPDQAPMLNGDPLYNAQEWQISDLVIDPASIANGTATVNVEFLNFDEPKQLTLALVMTDGGWRVDDIVYPDQDYTLRQLLSGP